MIRTTKSHDKDQNRDKGEVRTRLCARCGARAPRPRVHAEQLPGGEGVGRGGPVAGAPHRFARCYCVFLPRPAAQKAVCSFFRRLLLLFCSICPWRPTSAGLLFSSPRPFQGKAFCSGHLPRPLSHPLRYHRNAAAAASPEPGGGRAVAHGRCRRHRARGRGRTGVGGPERAGARDEAIFRRRELAFPSSRWAAAFLCARARRQQRA
jgi:hypothetical protein